MSDKARRRAWTISDTGLKNSGLKEEKALAELMKNSVNNTAQKSQIIITPERLNRDGAVIFGARINVEGECSFLITAPGNCSSSSTGNVIAYAKRILRMI